MAKITDQQIIDLEVACAYGNDGNFQGARDTLAISGIEGDTYTTDKRIARLMIRALWSACKPNDFGRDGKAGEAETRLDAMGGRKRFVWRWSDCWTRGPKEPDGTYRAGRKMYRVESKTGVGDWRTVHTNDFRAALEELTTETGWIRWHTIDFDIFLPFEEFYQFLENYSPKKGIATWFDSHLSERKTAGEYGIKMQPYRTSRKKMTYLTQVEASGYNWDMFAKYRQLIRNADL